MKILPIVLVALAAAALIVVFWWQHERESTDAGGDNHDLTLDVREIKHPERYGKPALELNRSDIEGRVPALLAAFEEAKQRCCGSLEGEDIERVWQLLRDVHGWEQRSALVKFEGSFYSFSESVE